MGKAVYTGKGREGGREGGVEGGGVAKRLATVLHTVAEFTVRLLCKSVSALQLQTPKREQGLISY